MASTVSILCPGPSLDRVKAGDLFGYRVAVSHAIYRDDLRPDAWCTVEGAGIHSRSWRTIYPLDPANQEKCSLSPWHFDFTPELWVTHAQRDERRDHKDVVLCRGWKNVFPELPIGDTPPDDEINTCMPWESQIGSWCQWSFLAAMAICLWKGATTIHLWGVDQEGHTYAKGCVPWHHANIDPHDNLDLPRCFSMRWPRERKITEQVFQECAANGIEVIRHSPD